MPVIAFLDVGYRAHGARAACLLAGDWCAETAMHSQTIDIDVVAEYLPGQFYLRELPCLLKVLEGLPLAPTLLVIDGYVWLDAAGRAGLGAHLYEALGHSMPVVGVAKTAFAGALESDHVAKVMRGTSRRPLLVTAAGVDVSDAAEWVKGMSGKHRIPTLLAAVDRLSRGTDHS
jgi:deoxyribonuclease V